MLARLDRFARACVEPVARRPRAVDRNLGQEVVARQIEIVHRERFFHRLDAPVEIVFERPREGLVQSQRPGDRLLIREHLLPVALDLAPPFLGGEGLGSQCAARDNKCPCRDAQETREIASPVPVRDARLAGRALRRLAIPHDHSPHELTLIALRAENGGLTLIFP